MSHIYRKANRRKPKQVDRRKSEPAPVDIDRMLRYYRVKKASNDKYYQNHAEEIASRLHDAYVADPASFRKYNRANSAKWQHANRDDYNAYQRQYYQNNAERLRKYHRDYERRRRLEMKAIRDSVR